MSNELGNGAMTDNPFLMPSDVQDLRGSVQLLTRSVDRLNNTIQKAMDKLDEHQRVVQFDASMIARIEALETNQPARPIRRRGK